METLSMRFPSIGAIPKFLGRKTRDRGRREASATKLSTSMTAIVCVFSKI